MFLYGPDELKIIDVTVKKKRKSVSTFSKGRDMYMRKTKPTMM